MKPGKTLARIGAFIEMFGSAVAVSRAVEAGRSARADDLRTLGIDPASFRSIRY